MGTTAIEYQGRPLEVVFSRSEQEFHDTEDFGMATKAPKNEVRGLYDDDGKDVTDQYAPHDIKEITKKIN